MSTAPYQNNLKLVYNKWLQRNAIAHDGAQLAAIELCYKLQNQIYKLNNRNFISRLFGLNHKIPKGLYIYGEVGRGKSMIMDLLYDTTDINQKRRVHFNSFMQEIHESLKTWRQHNNSKIDPLPLIAKQLSKDLQLLCFDEFYVSDITDAMILSRLFENLFKNGVIVVATSNTSPNNLYKDGLQRENFIPFITILKKYVNEFELISPQDYRLISFARLNNMYITPCNNNAHNILEESFSKLTNNAKACETILTISGRKLSFPCTHGDIAMIDFFTICGTALGPNDYIAIAKNFSTLIIHGIPYFDENNSDQGKRFISLIDQLYEHKVKLICSAEDMPDKLCHNNRLEFEFKRTASRLNEMQSKEYLALRHAL